MFKPTHRSELRLALITALALLFAQLGALGHAYSHDAALAAAGRAEPVSSSARQLPSSHDFCSDCLSFAPLLFAAGTPASIAAVLLRSRATAPAATGRAPLLAALRLAFRPRAPPAA